MSPELAVTYVRKRQAVLALKRLQERCEYEERGDYGTGPDSDPGVPRCYQHMAGEDVIGFAEWCGACQRNQARYLLRCYFQRQATATWRKLSRPEGR